MNNRGSDAGKPPTPGTFGATTVAVSLLCFAVGLAGGTLALRDRLPAGGSPDDRVEIKLDHLRQHPDRYDTLFIGSSRTFRGFVPEVFDQITAALGVTTRSFNLGVPGSRALETHRLLERVVDLELEGIRTVFVDPEGFEVLLDEGNYLSRKVIDWHDLETTRLVSEYIRANQSGRAGTREKLWMHSVSCAYNLAGVGRALPWVDQLLGTGIEPEWRASTMGPAGDGYSPQERSLKKGFKKHAEAYADAVADLALQDAALSAELDTSAPDEAPVRVFQSIATRIEALGAEPIFVAQAGMYLNRDLVLAAERDRIDTLLRFDQPDRHSDLYVFEARYDNNHLNHLGAERFTRHLAEAYLALRSSVDEGGPRR